MANIPIRNDLGKNNDLYEAGRTFCAEHWALWAREVQHKYREVLSTFFDQTNNNIQLTSVENHPDYRDWNRHDLGLPTFLVFWACLENMRRSKKWRQRYMNAHGLRIGPTPSGKRASQYWCLGCGRTTQDGRKCVNGIFIQQDTPEPDEPRPQVPAVNDAGGLDVKDVKKSPSVEEDLHRQLAASKAQVQALNDIVQRLQNRQSQDDHSAMIARLEIDKANAEREARSHKRLFEKALNDLNERDLKIRRLETRVEMVRAIVQYGELNGVEEDTPVNNAK